MLPLLDDWQTSSSQPKGATGKPCNSNTLNGRTTKETSSIKSTRGIMSGDAVGASQNATSASQGHSMDALVYFLRPLSIVVQLRCRWGLGFFFHFLLTIGSIKIRDGRMRRSRSSSSRRRRAQLQTWVTRVADPLSMLHRTPPVTACKLNLFLGLFRVLACRPLRSIVLIDRNGKYH